MWEQSHTSQHAEVECALSVKCNVLEGGCRKSRILEVARACSGRVVAVMIGHAPSCEHTRRHTSDQHVSTYALTQLWRIQFT